MNLFNNSYNSWIHLYCQQQTLENEKSTMSHGTDHLDLIELISFTLKYKRDIFAGASTPSKAIRGNSDVSDGNTCMII